MKNRHIPNKNRRSNTRHKPASKGYNRVIVRDFSAIEDNADAFRLIHKLANNAGAYAAAEAVALGLGTAYVQGNKLVKISADGKAVAINPRLNRASFYVKYKPTTILHVVKK